MITNKLQKGPIFFIILVSLLVGIFTSYHLNASAASSTKLNDALVDNGNVIEHRLSNDSKWVVYRADQDTDGMFEIYSVPINGGNPIKLNDTLNAGGNITQYKITSDSTHVVYRADQELDEVFELYSVPIVGGKVTKLNDSLVSGGNVLDYEISADSNRVVYVADQDTDGVTEIYSVPTNGGTSVRLNKDLIAGENVYATSEGRISPDSHRVIYGTYQYIAPVLYVGLYSVPIDGGTVVRLDNTASYTDQITYQISANSEWVVYRVNQGFIGPWELYSVPINGGTPINLTTTTDQIVTKYLISDDNQWVVYQVAQDEGSSIYELYSVPINGGQNTKLNGDLVAGGTTVESNYKISPNSKRVIYQADQDMDEVFELYSVAIDGGTVVKLNGDLISGGDVVYQHYISPDSSRIFYQADQDQDDVFEFYSAPINGGVVTKLSDNLVSGGDVQYCYPPIGNKWVVYPADQDTDDVYELYKVPTDGGNSTKLNGSLVTGGDIVRYHISADGNWVVYQADQDTDGVIELYSVSLNGLEPEIEILSGESIANGDNTPDVNDGTDFGSIILSSSGVTHTFVITNTGTASLSLASTPPITLTNGTTFNITTLPSINVIAPSTAVTFTINFNPSAAGVFTDTVTIANNDTDENPYTFTIAGTGKDESKYIIFLPLIINGPSEP